MTENENVRSKKQTKKTVRCTKEQKYTTKCRNWENRKNTSLKGENDIMVETLNCLVQNTKTIKQVDGKRL